MKITRTVFVCGCLLLGGGLIFSLHGLLHSYWSARPLIQQPLMAGQFVRTGWVDIDAERGRVGLELLVRSRALAPELRPDRQGELVPLYRFPLDYRVIDQEGRVLLAQRVQADATGGRALGFERSYFGDSQLTEVTLLLDPFHIVDGPVQVEARLYPDRDFGAELDHASLSLRAAPPLLVISTQGVFAAVGGLVLMLFGLLGELQRAPPRAQPQPVAIPQPQPKVKPQRAPAAAKSAHYGASLHPSA